jgi:hypothetical protein
MRRGVSSLVPKIDALPSAVSMLRGGEDSEDNSSENPPEENPPIEEPPNEVREGEDEGIE